MIAIKRRPTSHIGIVWVSVVLAALAALAYLLIGFKMLSVGDLATPDRPAAIIYVAASCYMLGGLLILLRRRWLWAAGAAINALVMLVFYSAYAERPAVLLSPGGMATKLAQILLEVGLIYLIVADWRRAREA